MPAVRKNEKKKIKKLEKKKEADILFEDDQAATIAATSMDEKNGGSIKSVIASPKENSKKKGKRKAEAKEAELKDENTLQNNEDELLLKNISPTKKAKTNTKSTQNSKAANGKKETPSVETPSVETPSVETHDAIESPKRGGRRTKDSVTESAKDLELSTSEDKKSPAKVLVPKRKGKKRGRTVKAVESKEDKIKEIDVEMNKDKKKRSRTLTNIEDKNPVESDETAIETQQDGKKGNRKLKSAETKDNDNQSNAKEIELVKSPKKLIKKAEKLQEEDSEESNFESLKTESNKKGRKAKQLNSIKSEIRTKEPNKKSSRILSKKNYEELADTDNEITSERDSKKKNNNRKNDSKGTRKRKNSKQEMIEESTVEVSDGVIEVAKRNRKVKNDILEQIDIPQKPELKKRAGKKPVVEVSKVIEHPKKIEKITTSKAERKAPNKRGGLTEGNELSPKVVINKAKMNSTVTNFENIDFGLDKKFNLKISSWNVAGLRSWVSKGCTEYLKYENPDIFCVQETKCDDNSIPEDVKIDGYQQYWLCKQGGYAGVALFSKIIPINVQYGIGNDELDVEDRIITVEYEDFFLVNTYVPNAGRGLVTLSKRLKWNDLFIEHIDKLNAEKPVVITGDMNVAHEEIDLANPKTNKKSAGFTQEERDGMTTFLSHGYVDVFRHFYPQEEKAFTFWSYMGNARSKNVGWRLDYFLVSKNLIDKCVDKKIRSEVKGSDHCPITLFLNTE